MMPVLQAKLLRFLEEKAFKRVGASTDIKVDVRVIAATNRKLEDEVRQGKFREDLYYRLNVLPIALPPLRARAEDLPLLINFYIDIFNREFKKRVRGVTPDAMARLQTYPWPGNVRELRNAIERAMLLTEEPVLGVDQFPLGGGLARLTEGFELPATGVDLEQLERSLVVQALERSGWNQTKAAGLLGLNRDQIRYRVEKFKLERPAQA
jgi:transcriptional regulator with PAS, ATPase and Fis domain